MASVILVFPADIVPPSLDSTLGAVLLGCMAMILLYGYTLAQTVTYFLRFRGDAKNTRATVGLLLILDTLHVALTVHAVYSMTVTNYANYFALVKNTWSIMAGMVPSMLVIAIVQYIWVMRVWTFNHGKKRTVLTAVQSLFVLAELSFGIAWVARTWRSEDELARDPWLIAVAIMLVTLTDFVNCVTMSYLLYRTRNGFQRTDHAVRGLISFTLKTGLVCCMLSIALLLTIILTPKNHYYFAIYLVLSKLYVNGLLLLLNRRTGPSRSRPQDTESSTADVGPSFQLSTLPWGIKTEGSDSDVF